MSVLVPRLRMHVATLHLPIVLMACTGMTLHGLDFYHRSG